MKKLKTINSFFNKKSSTEVDTPSSSEAVNVDSTLVNVNSSIVENRPLIFERDPGLRPQIWEYPVNQQDEMRRAYIKAGPYQHKLLEYPSSGEHNRRFQYSWFEKFPWLEYSPAKDAAYCSACYVFNKQLSVRFGTSSFTIEGFRNWKKVNGKDCAFLSHVGKDHWSHVGKDQCAFIDECSQAYYVHCFAHKLQLVLVATAKKVKAVHNFFNELIYIINTVGASSKRNDQLRAAQKEYFDHMIALGEIETGTGANQIGSLQRHGDTRWSSHLNSVCSVINMYTATCSVLLDISDNGGTSAQRGDAEAAFKKMRVFEFVFVLHLMKEVLGISDILCKTLQHQAQDILNVISLVSTTKALIQKLRASGWEKFLHDVKIFCEKNEVEVPEMNVRYSDRRFRSPRDIITVEHHFRVDIFNATIDCVLQELNSRFSENSMELLRLSMALDPSDEYKSFNIDDICALAKNFYPQDFSEHEIYVLNTQLQHYELDVRSHKDLKNLPTISKLCEKLVETKKSKTYYLIDKLVRLILTLPVSTATTERSFSAMKLIKTRLRNKMEDEFLANCMTLYIEREIAEKIDKNLIIDEFYEVKNRRAQLK